ncbi:MAG: DNA repair protein RadA [Firmicutes bacterium]|nr:DNA repair protein RadA [Bacillota bacterium]
MAKKAKTVFVCQECGYESPKWMGQCICGAWNSMVEEKVIDVNEDDKRSRSIAGTYGNAAGGLKKAKAMPLKEVSSGVYTRIDTGIGELNRVLGGGLVKGSLTLISGEPGIGKSTLIIQAASNIAAKYGKVLYVSGEESEEQIKMRADRVCSAAGLENLFILSETNMENVEEVCKTLQPAFVIIDSIQTMYTSDIDSAPGSVSQVRACGNMLMRVGKVTGVPIFIVAHVTKSGELAGPKIVEHLVDCVLNFTGERSRELRILRSVKNRFGTTSEIGAFEMVEEGLKEVENLSESFLEDMDAGTEGAAVSAIYEGTRPLLLEIQALAAPANVGFARRSCIGVDLSRLNMILAVLDRKAGVSLINHDVYVNIVGGLRPEDTSIDLAVALAIYSAYKRTAIDSKTLILGEIGLTGELRNVKSADKIIKEAARMGFNRVLMPARNASRLTEKKDDIPAGIRIVGVRNLSEAIQSL